MIKPYFLSIRAEVDNKNIQTDLIIMDFAQAFDKVPHHRLLYKLNYYGISGLTLHWMILLFSRWFITCLVTICSINFQQIQVNEMGL
jgi:hypothetical protein